MGNEHDIYASYTILAKETMGIYIVQVIYYLSFILKFKATQSLGQFLYKKQILHFMKDDEKYVYDSGIGIKGNLI